MSLPPKDFTVVEFLLRLDRIAKLNNDDFEYRFDLNRAGLQLRYEFVAEETADGHCILSGFGDTPEAACWQAAQDVKIAFKQWGYAE